MVKNNNTLDSITSVLQDNMPAGAKAILFGSQARGDANSESDWDILILLDKKKVTNEDFYEFAYPLIELGWTLDKTISPIMYTYEEWQKRHITPFYKNVEKDGIEIWH